MRDTCSIPVKQVQHSQVAGDNLRVTCSVIMKQAQHSEAAGDYLRDTCSISETGAALRGCRGSS